MKHCQLAMAQTISFLDILILPMIANVQGQRLLPLYLIKRKMFSCYQPDEPLSEQGYSFRKHGSQHIIPHEMHAMKKLTNIKSFDPDLSLKLSTNVYTWLEESDKLNMTSCHACLYEVPCDKPGMSDIDYMQKNKSLNFRYTVQVHSGERGGIVVQEWVRGFSQILYTLPLYLYD